MRLEQILDILTTAYRYLDEADNDLDIICTENSSTNPKEVKALGELVAHFNVGRTKIKNLIKDLKNED